MQAVVALPNPARGEDLSAYEERIFQSVAGIPLLFRVLLTGQRSGVTSFVVIKPGAIPSFWLRRSLEPVRPLLGAIRIVVCSDEFDAAQPTHWARLDAGLEEKVLWLPWNFVTQAKSLAPLLTAGRSEGGERTLSNSDSSVEHRAIAPNGHLQTGCDRPFVLMKQKTLSGSAWHWRADSNGMDTAANAGPPGIAVVSAAGRELAERFLVLNSGKVTDGFHSNFNRRLCRPLVRWLARTPVTANMISFAGLPAAALAGYAYAQGQWSAYVAGSLLYFISVLFDEMDGMVARIKFQESPFGNKLEAFVDFVSYLLLWTGMTIGLYRQRGDLWLVMGGLIFFGTFMSFILQSKQRKLAAPPDRPQDHVRIMYERFEADSGSWISWISRKLHFLTKKGALCHYVVWFSVFGLLPVFFTLTMLGANLLWIFGYRANRFFHPPKAADGRWKDSAETIPAA